MNKKIPLNLQKIKKKSQTTTQNQRNHDSLSVSPPIREESKRKQKSLKSSKEGLSKIISTIITKYKEGEIKEDTLERSLIQLIHKHKKNYVSKKKKCKKKHDESNYSERILEHKDFVKSIILKGIQPSLFLQTKKVLPSNTQFIQRINTSDSTKQVSLIITQQRNYYEVNRKCLFNNQQNMAIKIQRAWRQHQTQKIISQNLKNIIEGKFFSKFPNNKLKINKKQSNLSFNSNEQKQLNVQLQGQSITYVSLESVQTKKYQNVIKQSNNFLKDSFFFEYNQIENTNFKNLISGLQCQSQRIKKKKLDQFEKISENYLNRQICENTYNQQRTKIQKFYRRQIKQIQKVKSALQKSFKKANTFLQNEKWTQKSNKILKCLSEKLLIKSRQKMNPLNKNEVFTLVTPILRREKNNFDEDQASSDKIYNCQDYFQERLDETDSINNSTIINVIENTSLLQSQKFLQQSQQLERELRGMSTEDKEEVFQFIFLDLVLEIFSDEGRNKVMLRIEQHVAEAKRLESIPKGIKTSIASSKQYLKSIYLYVNSFRKDILFNLNQPMGPSAFEMLNYMHDNINDAEDCLVTNVILPSQLFQSVSKTPENQPKIYPYFKDQEKEKNRVIFLKSVNHIKNKALFDSLNQMLDQQRPYGVWGKPFPWKKTISNDKKFDAKTLQMKFRKSIEKTVQNCSFLCGILVDKQQSLFTGQKITQEYIDQIREDRMSKMLAEQLLQKQNRWIFYDDQETQIFIDITRFITVKLIKEVVYQFNKIKIKI